MRKKWRILLLLLTTQIGCGLSPAFHHASPNRSAELLAREASQQESGCPIFLSSENLCTSIKWTTEPVSDSEGAFQLHFWKKDSGQSSGPFVNPTTGSVAVKLWMKSMGHGSQKVGVAQAKDASENPLTGVYDAKPVVFIMTGTWEIWVQLKDSTGKVLDQAKIDYTAN